MEDELVWLLEKSGNYSTKSGYALAKIHKGEDQPSFNWKRYVWNVECSPKLRHFLWKLKNNALTVGEIVQRRGMQVDGHCKSCGEDESILHVMFTCPVAKKVWDLVPAVKIPLRDATTTMEDLLKACASMTNLPPSGLATPLYPWIPWVLWTSMNQKRFEDKSFSETVMVTKALKAAKEWQASLPPRKQTSVSKKDNRPQNTPNVLSQVPDNTDLIYSKLLGMALLSQGGLAGSALRKNAHIASKE